MLVGLSDSKDFNLKWYLFDGFVIGNVGFYFIYPAGALHTVYKNIVNNTSEPHQL